ncbi:MAG: putative Ig domain-containing protein [Rubrobacter sp.]
MKAVRTDHSSIFEGGNRRGRNSLYALGIALILGALVSVGLAGQAKGAPGPDPCATDSTSYGVNAGGGRILGSEGIFCRDTADMPSKYGNAAEAGNRTFNLKPVATGGPAIDMSDPSIPEGTPEALFRTERWDPGVLGGLPTEEMSWKFPATPGTYEVRLYFAEIWSNSNNPTGATCCQGEDQRVFDVNIEGGATPELDNYDVFKEAGGGFKGVVETFTVASNDGTLNVDFSHVDGKNNPAVKAVEVLDAAEPGNEAPVFEPVEDQNATEGEDFSLDLQASDADNDSLTYSVEGLPNGLTIDPTNGEISGKPALGSAADSPYLVEAKASDGTDTGSESFELVVSKGANPTISRLKPSGKTRDRTPRISAVVRDADDELGKSDIKLYVDGRARTFAYDPDTDRLSGVSRRLSYGGHTVKVVATDEAGNTAVETSRFKVVRR